MELRFNYQVRLIVAMIDESAAAIGNSISYFLTTKCTIDTKGSDAPEDASASICVADIYFLKLRGLRVLRGEIFFLFAALPRLALCG